MKLFLKTLFTLFFLAILYGTVTASLDRGIVPAIKDLWPDLWFQATLIDTYMAFLTIYVWIAYKEPSWISRIVWLFLIIFLGTFAFTTYILIQLFQLKKDEPCHKILLRKETSIA